MSKLLNLFISCVQDMLDFDVMENGELVWHRRTDKKRMMISGLNEHTSDEVALKKRSD